ncbi:Sec-independent protein translocase subunit TatC [Lelliottia amnigena]|nr:Sec-independent protein translocase subunit TatC [Lelliottia amnigena]
MAVDDTQPLIAHLIELRKRLLNCIIAVLLIFLCLVYFANDIYQIVSAPLIKQMPLGATMICDRCGLAVFHANQADFLGFADRFCARHFVSGVGFRGTGVV